MDAGPNGCKVQVGVAVYQGMSRRTSLPALIPCAFLCALAAVAPAAAESMPPLIERAQPDPERGARVATWVAAFASQRPALERARGELERERDFWRSSAGTRRCRRAAVALEAVDQQALFAVADYRLASTVGRAFDQLRGAVGACLERRYFELDYRLGIAARALDAVPALVRATTHEAAPRPGGGRISDWRP